MTQFSRSLKFACVSAVLILGACTHKQEAVNTAPPPAPPPADRARARAGHLPDPSGQRRGFPRQCRRHRPFRL